MDEFVRLTPVQEDAPGTMRRADLGGHEFLVARVGDEYFVTDARCAHLGGDLTRGTLDHTVVTCPSHGSQFDVTDGRVLRWTDWSGPVLSVAELLRHPRPIRAFESKVEDGSVWVGPQKPSPPVDPDALRSSAGGAVG
jgi:3-phenylpropionate/trans-cinnamate dioxygenase ferredoxin subunit